MTNVESFRSRGSVFAAWVAYIIIVGVIVSAILSSSLAGVLIAAGAGTLAAASFYLILHKPRLNIGDEGLEIINPLWSYTIGWSDVDDIEVRYTMSVSVGGKRIYAWAAPAPSRYHARKIHPSEVRGMDLPSNGTVRFGESPRSDSGVAAHLTRTRWKKFPQGHRQFAQTLDVKVLYICGVAAILLFVGLLIH